jgi:hypothetical protein
MTPLEERELAQVLRSAVPQPPRPGDRAARVRTQAHKMRVRRRVGTMAAAAAVALAVALPVGLTTMGAPPSSRAGTVAPQGPALKTGPHIAVPTTPPGQGGYCGSASCDPHEVLAAIQRPLHLPSTGPDGSCPVSPIRRLPGGGGFSGPFTAIGTGPLYLAGPVTGSPVVPTVAGRGGWREQKVIWVVSGSYAGPLLLRGGRVDGTGRLRFEHYLDAAGRTGSGPDGHGFRRLLYLRGGLQGTPSRVLESYPSPISMPAPGCYAVQVDGKGFSQMLVFRAVR